jgi:AbiU2
MPMSASRTTLNTVEALRRVHEIETMLRANVREMSRSYVIMETANSTVSNKFDGQQINGAPTFRAIQIAMGLKIAMDLARIFDLTGKRTVENQDKASVPVLGALLARLDVQEALTQEARQWLFVRAEEEVRQATHSCLQSASVLEIPHSDAAQALKRVRDFRTTRLAHSLFDKKPERLPLYNDLKLLRGLAEEFTTHAAMATRGHLVSCSEWAEIDEADAVDYFKCVLDGVSRVPFIDM